MLVIPEVDAATVAGSLVENMRLLWDRAEIKQRNQILSSMLEAVLLDPEGRSVIPEAAIRPAWRTPWGGSTAVATSAQRICYAAIQLCHGSG